MKKILGFIFFLTLILPLFGCNVKKEISRECISDTLEQEELPGMYIESDIPQGASLSMSREDGRCAVFTHADYEIIQEIFRADSWDGAFQHISGRNSEDLKRFLAGNFPYEKYRCTWSVVGEGGTRLCQSVILYDGHFYYAVSVDCAAEKTNVYEEVFSDLLSGVHLCGT